MRAVFDTNIFVSAVISKGKEAELLIIAHNGGFVLVTSLEILKEFKDVISRPKFGFSKEQIDGIILHIIEIAELVEPDIKLKVIKEVPEDNKILGCAVFSKADYIISGDKHLLNLGKIKNIKILKSTEFLLRFFRSLRSA